ncbi:MAG: phage integrase family protein [Proteobacteria bacterium]|nr:phage integrase family protein [Pseudomonadota bacterium]
MSAYIDAIRKPTKTLTDLEQNLLLKVTGRRRDGFRDHMIYSLALGTGLREHELAALDVGDVLHTSGKPRRIVQLRVFKSSNEDADMQTVILPDNARLKLEKFWTWKRRKGQSVTSNAPLFISRKGNRISKRQLRHSFGVWQERAGFERRLTFHSLRHSACSNVQKCGGDLRKTQRFARHKSPISTSIYTEPSDEDMVETVRDLRC